MNNPSPIRYVGFADHEDLHEEFRNDGWYTEEPKGPIPDFPTDDQILVAVYTHHSYSDEALVVFQRDGKLYEVNASHCSWHGLEHQWNPEETSIEALLMRKPSWADETDSYDYDSEAAKAWREFLVANNPSQLKLL